eukprot:Skav212946  [mRNA]  locus=scaffold374:548601:549525:+ [translate_table: standard]
MSSKAFPSGAAGIGDWLRVASWVPAEEDLAPQVGVRPLEDAQSDWSDHGLRAMEPSWVLSTEGGRKFCNLHWADRICRASITTACFEASDSCLPF